MRPACPPLVYICSYLNFSRSRSQLDLAARKATFELQRQVEKNLADFLDPESQLHMAMVGRIEKDWGSHPFITRDWKIWWRPWASPKSGFARTAGADPAGDDGRAQRLEACSLSW